MSKHEKAPAKVSLTAFIVFAIFTALVIATLMYCVFVDRSDKEKTQETNSTSVQNVVAQ